MDDGNILYALQDSLCFIKFTGKIRYIISAGLDSFIDDINNNDSVKDVLIDLTQTEYIDSTNLGLLAKITNVMLCKYNNKATIISTNENINLLLDSLGFDEFFIIINNNNNNPDIALQQVPNIENTDKERALLLLKTHRTLMDLNEKNKNVFQEVVKTLEKEVDDI